MTTREQRLNDLLKGATAGTWAGTKDLIGAMIEESKFAIGWRPMRAAALLVQAEMQPRIWMAPEEFARWRKMVKIYRTVPNSEADLRTAMGWTTERMTKYESGDAPIPKVVALACAHYLHDLPFPEICRTPEGFDVWVEREFSNAARITDFLDVSKRTMVHYRTVGAPGDLVRAMDWTLKMGGLCPFGAHHLVTTWPGQGAA